MKIEKKQGVDREDNTYTLAQSGKEIQWDKDKDL